MVPVIVPVVLGAAALGGLIWALVKKPSAPGAAVFEDLADRVAVKMPRGERAFKPDVAEGLVGSLASRFYEFPDDNERRVVRLKPNQAGTPISTDISAMGWAQSLNKSQSILAMLTAATTKPVQQLLRAVDPGFENQYAGPGGMYAVLLYAGTLEKRLAPPGVPPAQPIPNAAIPVDALQAVRDELGNHPELVDAVIALLQTGQDPDKMDQMAVEMDKVGAKNTAALLRKRAADLRAAHPAGPVGPGPAPTPTPATPIPAPQAGGSAALVAVQRTLNLLKGPGTPLAEDGLPGPKTTAAIRAFQASHGLVADGIVGPQTAAALQAALASMTGAGGGVPAFKPGVVVTPLPPVAPPGGTMGILAVQKALNTLKTPGTPLVEDGASGPKTSQAVKNFQSAHGLAADGIVGPNTAKALQAALVAAGGGGSLASAAASAAAKAVNMGILAIQKAMNLLHVPGTPIKEDGQSGPTTAKVIKAFQSALGLSADGVPGPMTVKAIQAALVASGGSGLGTFTATVQKMHESPQTTATEEGGH